MKPNKINDTQKRRAAHIKRNLIRQGMGEDEAARRALAQAVREIQGGRGGGSRSAGERPRPAQDPPHEG